MRSTGTPALCGFGTRARTFSVHGRPRRFAAAVAITLGCLAFASALPATAARVPQPVSPGAEMPGAVAEARCPTFSWAGVPGAEAYQIAVFRVPEGDGEPALQLSATVLGDARGYTPPVGRCLERGQRYAWSVAAVHGDRAGDERAAISDQSGQSGERAQRSLAWSPAYLFEVEAAPSPSEVERRLAALERLLDADAEGVAPQPTAAAPLEPAASARSRDEGPSRAERAAAENKRPRRSREQRESAAEVALDALAASLVPGVVRDDSASITPPLTPLPGDASLAVSGQIHLAEASAVFKEGQIFLWGDSSNLALGRDALASVDGNGANTAVGQAALRYATGGVEVAEGSNNTAVGFVALQGNTTGYSNTGIGRGALGANTTGHHNTASGATALAFNTTGNHNTASGFNALFFNSTGSRNTANGSNALFANTTGADNSASGFHALRANTTGYENTASGAYALASNTTGKRNSASGFDALRANTTGYRNTASGANALASNTTGHHNTASGYDALRSNTTGVRNTGSGAFALAYNTDGVRNTASGFSALRDNIGGHDNTASGYGALANNESGYGNTATGSNALAANTSGDYNTAIGGDALEDNVTGYRNVAVGLRALSQHTAPRDTVALGFAAGDANTSGTNNVFISNIGVFDDTHTIRIGTSAGAIGSNHLRSFVAGIHGVNPAGAIPVVINAGGQLGAPVSTRALKRDIQDLGELAERLLDLHPVAFRFRQNVETDPDAPLEFGLIAEEVAEVLPDLVVFDEEGKPQSVKYHLLSSLLLGALQEQQAALERYERVAEEQQAELRRLAAAMEKRESRSRRAATR